MNRILALLAVPLLAASLSAPAHAYPPREWRFNVLLDNKPFGQHRFDLSLDQHQQVLKSEAEFGVKFLGFNALVREGRLVAVAEATPGGWHPRVVLEAT